MKNFKTAFTLAEVLITLAIVGVVAALTIPTLVQAYKKRVVETKLLKIYSTMNQAIKLSTIDNGETNTWELAGDSGHNNSTYEDVLVWFNKYLAPYIKYTQVKQRENSQDLLVYFLDRTVLLIQPYIYDMRYYINPKCLDSRTCEAGINDFRFRLLPRYASKHKKQILL